MSKKHGFARKLPDRGLSAEAGIVADRMDAVRAAHQQYLDEQETTTPTAASSSSTPQPDSTKWYDVGRPILLPDSERQLEAGSRIARVLMRFRDSEDFAATVSRAPAYVSFEPTYDGTDPHPRKTERDRHYDRLTREQAEALLELYRDSDETLPAHITQTGLFPAISIGALARYGFSIASPEFRKETLQASRAMREVTGDPKMSSPRYLLAELAGLRFSGAIHLQLMDNLAHATEHEYMPGSPVTLGRPQIFDVVETRVPIPL